MKTNRGFTLVHGLLGEARLLVVLAGLLLWGWATQSLAQHYTVLHHFTWGLGEGVNPYAPPLVAGTCLYGTTSSGGLSNAGTVFRLSTDGTEFSILKSFTGPSVALEEDGRLPRAGLVLAGTRLYGTTVGLPVSSPVVSHGTIFTLNTNGADFRLLTNFISTRANPMSPLVLSGPTLYGTTYWGGVADVGAIFRLNTDGAGFTWLYSFSPRVDNGVTLVNADGCFPRAGLLLSDGVLYGTAAVGGPEGYGTVFKVNTDGSGFTVLKSFSGVDGATPSASLALAGSTLYGTTYEGGSNDLGTVFRLHTDGSGFRVLKHFSGPDGANPYATPALCGTNLFGTTQNGGTANLGTVFVLDTNGNQHTVLKHFTGPDGANPSAGVVFSDGNLYGTTTEGGLFSGGVAFRLSLAPPTILQSPQTQTVEAGAPVELRVEADGSWPLFYLWSGNGTNCWCGTSNRLQLPAVTFAQAGVYTVVVTNVLGAATSAAATLAVIPPVERRTVPGLSVVGESGSVLNVESTDALGPAPAWLLLDTFQLTNSPQWYFDLSAPLPPQRFYRLSLGGTPAVGPALHLPRLVPALTLTGPIGMAVRIDYINQFGPTEAWETLDTVILAHPPQLYFDLSAWQQEPRLYRIVPVP